MSDGIDERDRPRGDAGAGPVVQLGRMRTMLSLDESLARRPRTPDPCVVRHRDSIHLIGGEQRSVLSSACGAAVDTNIPSNLSESF
jgi:hypothetical protein